MRRIAGLCALLIYAARPAGASDATARMQTLVGWSADGTRWAVIDETMGDSAELEIYDHAAIVEVFASGFENVDVVSWAPTKKYALLHVTAAQRTAFARTYEIQTVGKPIEFHDRCSGGGWSVLRKRDRSTVETVRTGDDHCFDALGGYASADGKYLLVKLTENSASQDPQGGYASLGWSHFEFVEVPVSH